MLPNFVVSVYEKSNPDAVFSEDYDCLTVKEAVEEFITDLEDWAAIWADDANERTLCKALVILFKLGQYEVREWIENDIQWTEVYMTV